MAMTMSGRVELAVLIKTDANQFQAVAKMKIGSVSARFKGKVTLSDLDPPNGYKIAGEGRAASPDLQRVKQP